MNEKITDIFTCDSSRSDFRFSAIKTMEEVIKLEQNSSCKQCMNNYSHVDIEVGIKSM